MEPLAFQRSGYMQDQKVEKTAKPNDRRQLVGVIAASTLGLMIIAGAIAGYMSWRSNSADDGYVCSGDLEMRSIDYLERLSVNPPITELETIVSSIEDEDDGTLSSDCLYTVSFYYSSTGNIEKAKEYAQRLKVAYENGSSYSTYMSGIAQPPEGWIYYLDYVSTMPVNQGALDPIPAEPILELQQ